MRSDGKPEGLRQSMSWFHTWTGLLLGWLLYAVFFTGTLSYFVDEISTWMKPELHQSIPAGLSQAEMATHAVQGMERIAPGATSWSLSLPAERQLAVSASWREPGAAEGRAGQKRADLDAATGEKIDARATRGGSFLYRFHFELYAIPRIWSRTTVAVATFLMFVAIISGVITHKKIFTDFFTFRGRKGQRSWLDAHNASAVLALPFHIMITFSGLLLFMNLLMPWAVDAVYQGDQKAYQTDRRASNSGRGGPPVPSRNADAATPAPLTAIAPLVLAAEKRWPDRGVGNITIQAPGTTAASIELRERGGSSLSNRGAGERMLFDGVTGELHEMPPVAAPSAMNAIYNTLVAPHLGRMAGPGFRWLLFFSGIAGTLMVATGLVLWVVKRLPDRRKLGRTPWGHRLVEVLNLATIGGLSLATAGYFWANRLWPAELEQRSDFEIRTFFTIWALALVHAVLRSHRSGWMEQLALAALMFAALPVLNAATGGHGLFTSVALGQWPVAGFDLAMLVFAAVHGLALYYLWRKAQATQKTAVGKAGTAQKTTKVTSLGPDTLSPVSQSFSGGAGASAHAVQAPEKRSL